MDTKNWKIITSTIDYENPFFKIFKKSLIRPDGTESTYYVLERETSFFSIVIPLTDTHETYLIGQYRVPTGKYSWELPMGGVVGKEPLETAQQELIEETGLRAKHWEDLGWFYVANGHTNQRGYVFLAQELSQGEARPEAGEFLEVKKVPIKQVGLMIKNGEIKDGPTISAYQLLNLKKDLFGK
ncbi:MAG: NUDIX hydrolase [Candidatus Roizmanbacteria bacterium]|nr:NUDIX hydrolase [Candidatus Roizmanbacteria bacterium]